MKKIIAVFFVFVALIVWACAHNANATPYFRLVYNNGAFHPEPVVGALLDPTNMANTSATTLLPLVTHSPNDGCLLPSIICEDWSPIAAGVSVNAGKVTFDAGPLFNVLPFMSAALYELSAPDMQATIDQIKAQNPNPAVTFSAGPMWEYEQLSNKGYFKVFTGLALHF